VYPDFVAGRVNIKRQGCVSVTSGAQLAPRTSREKRAEAQFDWQSPFFMKPDKY
jgi:hypothetical protein